MKVRVDLEVDSPHIPHLLSKIAEIAMRLDEIDGVQVLDVKQVKNDYVHRNGCADVWAQVVDKVVKTATDEGSRRSNRDERR